MKILILISAFFITSVFSNETRRYTDVSELMQLTHIDKWIDFVKVIKSDEDIPPFLPFKEPTSRERKVLLGLNLLDYEKGLRNNLSQYVTDAEFTESLKLYRNPFINKTINAVNFFEIFPVSLEDIKSDMHPKLRPLIISIYNILGHESILIEEFKSYKEMFLQRKKAVSILQNSNDIVQEFKNTKILSVDEYRELYFQLMYKRVKELSIPELREFIRMTRSNKSFLKVNQVLTSYSYGFIASEVDKIDTQDKRKSQLGL